MLPPLGEVLESCYTGAKPGTQYCYTNFGLGLCFLYAGRSVAEGSIAPVEEASAFSYSSTSSVIIPPLQRRGSCGIDDLQRRLRARLHACKHSVPHPKGYNYVEYARYSAIDDLAAICCASTQPRPHREREGDGESDCACVQPLEPSPLHQLYARAFSDGAAQQRHGRALFEVHHFEQGGIEVQHGSRLIRDIFCRH